MTLAALILVLIATPADLPSTDRGEPVLLDFHTEWCSPCRAMRPAIAKLIDAGYPVRSVDGDREKDLVRKYGVDAFPTFIVVDEDGRALARVEGARPAQELATLYREAQAKVRSRPAARTVASRREDDEVADDDRAAVPSGPNAKPWQTVVRVRMRMGHGMEGMGSGTVIYSDADSSLILTCAHIFKEEGRKPTPPKQFRMPIEVDLFDGVLGGPKKNQVHYVETVRGEAIDYDFANDVGLIRIRPGKVLPAAKVVPPYWHPKEGMHMLTVGCSEGHDATAWDTQILRAQAGLRNTGTGETFHVIECKNPPKQGRSGGGLFTDDFYVAGVCDFADPQHGNGLYAEPASIYRLLDRNKLVALYDSSERRRPDSSREMLADGGRSRGRGVYRGQSPTEGELTMPPPSMFGIKPPVVASGEVEARKPATSGAWRGAGVAKMTGRPSPARREAETEAIPAEMSRENVDAPPAPAAEEVGNSEDLPLRPGQAKWRPVRRADEGM
jgi:thiol-disulfide isomerase/thioredoxin